MKTDSLDAQYVADCPRCGVRHVTFDWRGHQTLNAFEQRCSLHLEVFCVCRACGKSTVFRLYTDRQYGDFIRENGFEKVKGDVTALFQKSGFVNTASFSTTPTPEHLPSNVEAAFCEGARCLAVDCSNAGVAMLRLCLDLASKELLLRVSTTSAQPNQQQRKDLAPRLDWLIEHHYLPAALQDLVHCIRDDGNVAAHDGKVTADDAEETMDLTLQVLNRVYTEPANLAAIKARQAARKAAKP